MAVIKCKMCGGDLTLIDGQSVAQCEYCGSRQTVPAADNEKKLNLFARANRLRTACEFDKAAGIYEAIVADFPEEAEAYWGLVLCRYGIEYVDDPGTGKKIPTCHRSSFDSVMTDPDFEQAQENADAIARKVYREEAKQIEELRKGIVEVSGKEEPYDIFICYKETAEDGQRTLDSVLAQDIYDALTDKGYRVFFSRITLEDKLGMEYEPYIFAALNSAKIMLAVGTDFEYYNAVWVKNEWSRYLKLMAADKTKHLIPCYKGLDAYDMPLEFAKLQAQDLGKLGAMQDLLRGIEKLLPKASPVSVVQERVVVGGSGDNKIASLLDRGNMALEDGDWAKADSFFEDVLNNDSKNAQAYLGKALAAEKCRTIDAFIRKRKESYGAVKEEKCSLDADKARIRKAEEAYTIPQYLSRNEIIEIYAFDLRYSSTVQGRKRQYQQEQTYWKEHKLLARAEQFATGAVAQNIQAAKKQLFDALADRVKKAEAEEGEQKKRLLRNYEAHLTQADARTKSFYEANLNCRESDYQKWVHTAKASADMAELKKLADFFKTLGDYKDSPAMAKFCNDRVAELQKQQDEAAWLEAKQAHAAEQKRKAIKAAIVALCIIAIAAVLVVTVVIIPNNKYNDAMALLESGEYQKAIDILEELGTYKDSPAKLLESQNLLKEKKHREAVALIEQGAYQEAIDILEELGPYGNTKLKEAKYYKAVALLESGEYQDAIDIFEELGMYENTQFKEAKYRKAVALMESGDKNKALRLFIECKNYRDSREQAQALWDEIAGRKSIDTGFSHTVGLKSDGTVVAVGGNWLNQCAVSDWKDIIAISAGAFHTVGLKSDGTVVAVGDNEGGQCDVSRWKDIVAISAGNTHTVGLKFDGTVVAVGDNEHSQCDVFGWKDIVAISAGYSHTVGLKSDGTVVVAGENYNKVSQWNDIVAISAGASHTVGLKSDGTVVVAGENCSNVSQWNDIVAISAGYRYTVGLKSDGTVVADGNNYYGQCDVSDWKDIVAINAGFKHTLGLKSDGTVVVVGDNDYGQCNVSDWKNIKIPE